MSNENILNTKEDRFKRLAQQRTRNVLKALKILGNCSNKSSYEYTEEDLKKIFSTIELEVKNTKNKFYGTLDSSEDEFTL
jgi:arsenate reductase-like glutaredoxin family protein